MLIFGTGLRIASKQDREAARALPDEYLRLTSPPRERILALIGRRWGARSERERRELTHILLAIFKTLDRDGAVSEVLRRDCEAIVVHWLERQR